MDKLLAKIYYNDESPYGFSSPQKLWLAAKKIKPDISLAQVKKWFTTQRVPSRFALARKKFPRATFVTSKANYTWTADLGDLSKLSKANRGFKWLLIVQDLFSRKLKALIPQKTKTSKETAQSLEKLFAVEKPRKFLVDQGGEFRGQCNVVYAKYGIHYYTTSDNQQKAATVERALLVVKQRLYKMMAYENSLTWINKLESVKRAFNNSFNRMIGFTPNDAEKPQNEARVFYNTVAKVENRRIAKKGFPKYKFEVGQVVRILKSQQFGKSYTGAYSNILYEIFGQKIMVGGIPVYFLRELLTGEKIKGSFYASELRPVSIDKSKLPKVDQMYGIRLNNEQEEVKVKVPGGRQHWVAYDSLIPYEK